MTTKPLTLQVMEMQEGMQRVRSYYSDADAYAQNGDYDAASMTANQAVEEWERVRPEWVQWNERVEADELAREEAEDA